MRKIDSPALIDGFVFADDRGVLTGCNSIDLGVIKRFYFVENYESRFIRAWHGHKFETKYLYCVAGSFLIGVVRVENFDKPDPLAKVETFNLTVMKPQLLVIPGGFANGLMNLTENSKLVVMSNKTLRESEGDDFRFDYDYWDVWSRRFR